MSDIRQIGRARRATNASREVSSLIKVHYAMSEEVRGQGGKVAWCMRGVPEELLFNLGIVPAYPENFGSLCAMKGVAVPFIEKAEGDGFSKDLCAYLRVAIGQCRDALEPDASPLDAPMGGLPRPDLLIAPSRVCDPRVKFFEAMSRYYDVPVFVYDAQTPALDDPTCADLDANRHYIEHNLAELRSLIGFLELQTGRRLDIDRLREGVDLSLRTWGLYHEIHHLRRNVPCPMPSEDAFHVMWPFLWLPGRKESVAFYERLLGELQDRIAAGTPAADEERFRVIWIGLPPYYDMSIFNYMESLHIVSVAETVYYPVQPMPIDTTDPVQAIVERWYWADMGQSDGSEIRSGVVGGNLVKEFVAGYRVDGAVIHNVRSCRATSIGSVQIAKVLKEEFNLPTLYLEGDMADIRGYSAEDTKAKLDAFAEVLAARTAVRRAAEI